MITRRGFLGILGGFAVAQAASKIYVLPPACGWNVSSGEALFYLPADGWSYRYAYRNNITGCVSDAFTCVPPNYAHTFVYPEMDVIDIYRLAGDNFFEFYRTVEGFNA